MTDSTSFGGSPNKVRRVAVGAVVGVGLLLASLTIFNSSASGQREPGSARLRPVPADTRRARQLLLTVAQLPHGFETFNTGASPQNNRGSCSGRGPNLSALTENAEVYGAGLANGDLGVYYVPSAYVFVSAEQAARAERLDTASEAAQCAIELVKRRLKGASATVLRHTSNFISRATDTVVVKGRQSIFDVEISGVRLRMEASLIFLRRGRALAEVWTSGPWNKATRRTWEDALSEVSQNLRRSSF